MSLDPDDFVPDGDDDDVGGGEASLGGAALIAQAAYPKNGLVPTNINTTDASGNPITFSLVPNFAKTYHFPNTSTSFDQTAVAYISPDQSQIIVGIEGTQSTSQLLNTDYVTWVSNGGDAPGPYLIDYLYTMALYIQSLQQAYPNAQISLTGHSLGGAEAQLLGYFMDMPATAINAPGVGGLATNSQVVSLFTDNHLIPSGYNPATDDVVNYNIFAPGDAAHTFGTPFGLQGVLSSTDPNSPVNTDVHWWQPAKNHSIDTWAPVLGTAGQPNSSVTIQPYTPPTPLQYTPGVSGDSVIRTLPVTPVQPSTSTPNSENATFMAAPNQLFLNDPAAGYRIVYGLGSDTPQAVSLLLPNDDAQNISSFTYWIEQSGAWSAPTTISLGTIINLPANVQAVRFEAFDQSGHLAQLPAGYLFYTIFGGSGSVSTSIASHPAATHDDFVGNGDSGILFAQANGNLAEWQMTGTSISGGGNIGAPGGTWTPQASGDFNGDWTSDLLFHDNSGNLAIWEMNGTAIVGGGQIGNPAGSWAVSGVGDFNGDGRSDVLFADASGAVAIWEMNGTQIVGGGAIGTPGGTWATKGVGDFNGDGKSDILFADASGNVAIWEMGGTTISGGGAIGNPGGTWQVKGVGDFNGDGASDILFEDATGQYAIWDMNGTAIAGGGAIGNPGGSWTFAGIGDYNGDGRSDILFHDASGNLAIWEMNDTQIVGGGLIGNPGGVWHITG